MKQITAPIFLFLLVFLSAVYPAGDSIKNSAHGCAEHSPLNIFAFKVALCKTDVRMMFLKIL